MKQGSSCEAAPNRNGRLGSPLCQAGSYLQAPLTSRPANPWEAGQARRAEEVEAEKVEGKNGEQKSTSKIVLLQWVQPGSCDQLPCPGRGPDRPYWGCALAARLKKQQQNLMTPQNLIQPINMEPSPNSV